MLKGQKGFSVVELVIILVILGVVGLVGLKIWGSQKKDAPTVTTSQSSAEPEKIANKDEPPLKLKSIGINLDYYNEATNKAGDIQFTKAKLVTGLLYSDFGYVISRSITASGEDKANPQPTFILPMGTKVRSLVDGVVVNIPKLYSNDYSIQVATDNKSQWIYETEHVINPLVKVGDKVKAGQIIAEVSPHDQQGNGGFGMYEIGILKGGNPPQHVCPFAYLDDSIKSDVQKKLLAFYKSWEKYKGNIGLYDESKMPIPGCLTLDLING